MKYKDTTQEQKDGITSYLKGLFEELTRSIELVSFETIEIEEEQIKAFQQAQKEEIKFLENEVSFNEIWGYGDKTELRIKKLKFESELE